MSGLARYLGNPVASVDWRLLLAVFLTLMATAGRNHAAGTVSGEVTTDDGMPVVGARAFLLDTFHAGVTDRDGAFRLSGIPQGEYLLFVSRPGFGTHVAPVGVDDGEPAHLKITMGANRFLEAAAAAYVDPAPERLDEKRAYLRGVDTGASVLPNLVVILFDDLGFGDLSAYGNRLISTPAIDRLAANGVKLNSFYSASPLCSASRVGLLTGRYPVRALSSRYVYAPAGSLEEKFLKARGLINHVPADEILLPEILQAAGYRTALVGKWHLGGEAGFLPNDLGFHEFYGVLHSNNKTPFHVYRDREIHIAHDDVDQSTLTRSYTNAARRFIDENRPRPFFLYLAHTFPHAPHHADPRHRGRSKGGLYGDMVEDLDRSVGAIAAALEEHGLLDRTMLVVTSDNGGGYSSNVGGLRGRKGDTFEGGMRVPGLFHWPGVLPRGAERDGLAMQIDVLPTVLEIIGVAAPDDRVIDGRDMLPFLKGHAPAVQDLVYYFSPYARGVAAVRDERYKFLGRMLKKQRDLFYPAPIPILSRFAEPMLTDVALDNESHDVSLNHPERSKRLEAAIVAFQASLRDNPRGWKP